MINRDFHKQVRVVYRALRRIYGIEKTQDEALRVFKLVFPELYRVRNSDEKDFHVPTQVLKGIEALREEWGSTGEFDNLMTRVISLMSMPVSWEKEPLIQFYEDILPVVMRIRKLTVREVFRLMDVEEEDIDKILGTGLSNSALYRCAGNSICKNTLYHIFRKLFIDTKQDAPKGQPVQLSLF